MTGDLTTTANAQSLAIENVGIYDVMTGTVDPGRNIAILDGRITQIEARSLTELPENTRVINGAGLTILPGLTDAHVHMNQIDTGAFLA